VAFYKFSRAQFRFGILFNELQKLIKPLIWQNLLAIGAYQENLRTSARVKE
jgi:hypothetical protein